MLTIAFDYDKTFNRDPKMFRQIASLVVSHGHLPILITARDIVLSNEIREVVGTSMPVVFAGGLPKPEAAIEKGYDVDIWIDDNPNNINEPSWYEKVQLKVRGFLRK